METLLIILFVLAVLAFVIQLEYMQHKYLRYGWLLGSGVFVYATHNLATEQSYDKFTAYLGNVSLMTDFVVVQVIEALFGALLAIFMIRKHFGEPVKKFFRFAIYWPGFLVFPALFYFSSFAYLNLTGFNFQLLAIILAFAIPLGLLGLHHFLTWLIPEFDIRAELKFIVHILQLIGGIILSIIYLKLPVSTTENNNLPQPGQLLIIALLAIGVIGLGMLKNEIIMRIKLKSSAKNRCN